ncbi:MAG: iron-containing alcohol dehydrogenase [Oscillospiraceae bacterium]|nr:iron-containing alcohol dehydrogenase [Oscillospiraceae bacterium]
MAASLLFKMYCRTYQGIFRVAVNFLSWKEPEVIKGAGGVKKLPEVVKANGHNSVLIVTDKGLMGLHLLDGLFEGLEKAGVHYVVYDGTQPNPTINNIEEARQLYLDNNCSAVIAFGGGSPMDCAKAAAARIARPKMSIQQMRGTLKILKKLPTLYAVPTTAGTGSETTLAAVVSDPATHEKYALQDPVLRPKYAVLDPELTLGLPPHITSTTGMDALTHAVEAYIGHSNTKGTIAAAEKATRMIFDNILKVYENGKDVQARENMLEASYLAGIAFTRAYVGYVHAIAHNFGGMYGTPHGLANAVILPYVLEWYGSSAYKPLAKLADVAGLDTNGLNEEQKAKLFIQKIKDFNKALNIPEHIDIFEKDIPIIAQRAAKEGNPLYPVPKIMDIEDFKTVIRQVGNL